ncbi:MAG: SAM-dependent methyltransferase [Coprothermobacterota bacterium]|nr:SAM-dependent methyltransferase [Coprothermobacterota bacterium]
MPDHSLVTIGWVRNGITGGSRGVDWKGVVSRIEIDPAFLAGLEGIEEFSHIYILFLLQGEEAALLCHPRSRADLPEVGVFASRSPHHPSPLGLTLVELLSRRGNELEVRGLDAWDGTAVLDLKPFMMRALPENLRYPAWLDQLERKGDAG